MPRFGSSGGYFGPLAGGSSRPRREGLPTCDAGVLRRLADPENLLQTIRPTHHTVQLRRRVFEDLRRVLMNIQGATNVILGGSMAKGTDLDTDSDVDVVVIFEDLERIEDASQHEELVGSIQTLLAEEFTIQLERRSFYLTGVADITSAAANASIDNRGTYVHGTLRGVPFDVLVGAPLRDDTPFRKSEPGLARGRLGGSVVAMHTQFLASARDIKDGIRLCKWWASYASTGAASRSLKPRGFLVELLTVHAVEQTRRATRTPYETFLAVLRLISQSRRLEITWRWSRSDWQQFHTARRHPIVLDPCNVTNNVARTLSKRAWSCLVNIAKHTLLRLTTASRQRHICLNRNSDSSSQASQSEPENISHVSEPEDVGYSD